MKLFYSLIGCAIGTILGHILFEIRGVIFNYFRKAFKRTPRKEREDDKKTNDTLVAQKSIDL